jgi:G:T-mismatch repair DNA endonuclease (very short patch repair protein)
VGENIHVPKELQFYDYRAVYDIETFLDSNITDLKNTEKIEWKQKHVLLSVSVCSNIPGYENPRCFVSRGSALDVVKRMVNYLHKISDAACVLMTNKLNPYIQELDTRLQDVNDSKEGKFEANKLESLQNRLDTYLNRLPVIGFNSGNYDLNVLKPHLVSYLQEIDTISAPIKRNNNWMSLSTERLQFLDICNYLAPGYSYEKYIKAYGASLQKSFFPYDWMDSLEKLNYPELPPQDAFTNKLKATDISNEDYEKCKSIWQEYNMKNMKDWLVYYNNLDVQPFIEALEHQFKFYKDRHMDMFKDGISVPGLTNKYLFDTIPDGSFFALMGENHKDLYKTILKNVVGGPSIVFNRYHWKDETYLRAQNPDIESELCKGIAGYDANALYLWSLSQMMPTGWYIRRRETNGFKLEDTFKQSKQGTEWLKWLKHSQGLNLISAINSREKRLGRRRIPVDGWDASTNTAYQYHGCYYHGCQCRLTTSAEKKKPELQKQRRERTHEISQYLLSLGIKLVEMKECEWSHTKDVDSEVQEFVESLNMPKHPQNMTEENIKKQLKDGSLFGLAEVNIEVPAELKTHFSEMTPVFKHATITKENVSPLMQQFANDNKLMTTPTQSLIGSYTGEKIMLATPLLQWYLQHGLVITKVYQVVEFQPHPCFKKFADAVSEARRAGDMDALLYIIAETMKLFGNSAYGKTLTDKEKQLNIYFTNEDQVSELINENRFKSLNVIEAEEIPDLYEVAMKKKQHIMDLPVHIGFFVYSYAKMRMLQFYYDLVDKFVDRSKYEYCQMDTDSAYIALASSSLDDLVKPELRQQYFDEYDKWFLTEACDKHMPQCRRAQLAGIQWPAYRGCKDCVNKQMYTKRTPGLFKLEYSGDGIIALCSKTYFTSNLFEDSESSEDDRRGLGYGSIKTATKALNKTQNKMTKEKFLNVLKSKTAGSGTNRGFRVMNNSIYTYTQQRSALSYFYTKRWVMDDGVSTQPLSI